MDETIVRDSLNNCKSVVGIDASQLHHYHMCQAMSIGLLTIMDLESCKFKLRQNKTRGFEKNGNVILSKSQTTIQSGELLYDEHTKCL